MKEIKFRIYLGGKFYYWGFIANTFIGLPQSTDESITLEENKKRSQQFIGHTDKNGKEIYAGDIMFNINDQKNYIMLWNESDACFMLGEHGGRLSKYVLAEFWEIIGNTYQSSEEYDSSNRDS